MTPGEEALATALDNLNAAFGTGAEMPIDPWNVRSLADLAEIGGRQDIADCLRDALKLIHDEEIARSGPDACECEICLERAPLMA